MSIEREGRYYWLYCDECDAKVLESFSEFQEAVHYMKINDWHSEKETTTGVETWYNICSTCAKD